MNLRYIDWIWHIRGSVPLSPEQTVDDAFDRLDPLFRQAGTTYERGHGTLIFRKKDPLAQDKMSIFDEGALLIETGVGQSVLRYRLISRFLLFCFLAPLFFIGMAQLTIVLKKPDDPAAKEESKTKEDKVLPINAIDKALGAPAPQTPEEKKAEKDEEGGNKKPSTTPAYVFAGIFVVLYVVGRLLESWLIKSLFRKKLLSA